jgi:hypothetical protein
MRHIPEDELHAYLDQGLSRTQCVEIESHLADCPSCRATRDGIAALRDRTTALLARLTTRRGVPPAFEILRRRAAERDSRRRRRASVLGWAASLVAAVGLGWAASSLARPEHTARPAPAVATAPLPSPRPSADTALKIEPEPVVAPAPAPVHVAARVPAKRTPKVRGASDSARIAARNAVLSALDPKPALELTQLERGKGQDQIDLDGMWRTMSWDGARADAGEQLPHIEGLPVLRVQVQSGEQGSRPVMVVAQQLSSGQVIRTIEGPASDVSQLLSRRVVTDVDSLVIPGDPNDLVGPDGNHAMAMQVGDRMLAITGNLPSDSLRAMIRRLNAEMRSK